MDLIVGTTGLIGSGKDTVGDLMAEELDALRVDISDTVRQQARARGISLARLQLTAFSAQMLSQHGPHYFVDSIVENIRREEKRRAAVVSSIRSKSNVIRFRDAFGRHFCLVAVEIADDSIRYSRIRHRLGKEDPLDDATIEDNDRIQEGSYGLSETIRMADFVIDNSGTLRDLRRQAREICDKLRDRLAQA